MAEHVLAMLKALSLTPETSKENKTCLCCCCVVAAATARCVTGNERDTSEGMLIILPFLICC